VILNNARTVMVFGGTTDEGDLRFWSTICGDRDEEVKTTNKDGRVTSRTVRKVPVFAPSQIRNLPEFKVIVLHAGMPPALARARMVWELTWRQRITDALEARRTRRHRARLARVLNFPPKPHTRSRRDDQTAA
jgi:type IV secretory pathway TraG/TraD family ATPase VirD4